MLEDIILLFPSVFTYLIVVLPYCIISTQSNVYPLYTIFFLPFFVNVLTGRVEVGAGGGEEALGALCLVEREPNLTLL